MSNNGYLFQAVFTRDDPHFEVPAGGEVGAIYEAQPWIAGLSDGELLFTGSSYWQQYYPGPLNDFGVMMENCAAYDKIYMIKRADLNEYDSGRSAAPDFYDWPAHLGAPVVDGNMNGEDYNLQEGDRPALVGSSSAWWVMNDGGRVDSLHYLGASKVGLQADVFAALLDPPHPDVTIVYFRYRFKYVREQILRDAYIGLFVDPEIGAAHDDAVGSDTLSHTGFAYNFYPVDAEYGKPPPAIAVTLLKGPVADPDGIDNDRNGMIDELGERLGMTAFISSDDEPHEFQLEDGYNHMQGLCGNTGNPIRVDGSGYRAGCWPKSGEVTKFWYSGDPVSQTGW